MASQSVAGSVAKALVHVQRGIVRNGIVDDNGGYARYCGMGGDIFQNDGAGCDFGAGANGDAPQYFSPRSDKNSGFHDGMAVPFFLARAAQRDFMQDGDVVPDDGGFPYHETGGVVQQDAAADGGRRKAAHRWVATANTSLARLWN